MSREPIPQSGRTFSLWDQAALWAAIGISLYAMPFGSLLVPALSLERAFLAVLVAALLGSLLVAAMAAIGAATGLTTAGLLESLLGPRAGKAATAILLARHIAVGALVLSVIASAAALVNDRALGVGLRPLWALLFGAIGIALALAGPEFFVRKLLRRGGVWLMLIVALVITLSAYLEFEVPSYLRRPAAGGWPEFWQAVDVMLVAPLLWLPLAADYGRHGRTVTATTGGAFLGFLATTAWLGYLGVVYLPATESGDIAGFVAGMNMSLAALLILMVLQSDESFANARSGGLALAALAPVGERRGTLIAGTGAAVLAAAFDFLRLEGSVLVLASAFVPLSGVLVADQILARTSGLRAGGVWAAAAWLLGFALYHWIAPPDAAWWQDATRWLFADLLGLPYPLTEEHTWLGAAIPSFLLAFAVQTAGGIVVLATRPLGKKPASEP